MSVAKRVLRLLPIVLVGLVALPILLLVAFPRALVGAAEMRFPGCLYETPAGAPERRVVALTIDDAPDPATTPAILDTLWANGARATFFVITNQLASAGADSLLQRLLREGNEVGNHGTADRAAIRLDSAAFVRDLRSSDSALRREPGVGSALRWARPGSGWYDRRMLREYQRAGYRCALGSIYAFDAQLASPWVIEHYISAHVRPGAIIILHDRGARRARTARVLGRLLPALRREGYGVVTLTELGSATKTR